MPIFEYACENCEKKFEALVLHGDQVHCPECQSSKLSKQYSRFGFSKEKSAGPYESLPLYQGGGCGCTPSTCGCKN